MVEVTEDGLEFLPESVKGAAIREDNIYDGVRVKLRANLGNAVIPLQIDIGFGMPLRRSRNGSNILRAWIYLRRAGEPIGAKQ